MQNNHPNNPLPPVFSSIFSSLYYTQISPSPSLLPTLLSTILPSYPEFENLLLYLKSTYRKEICSASISQGDLSFKCYDCGRNNEFHIFCENCFKKGEHKGHRYIGSCERGGCCDCGDSGAVDPVGFCQEHRGYQGIDTGVNLKVPQEIKKQLESFFKWSLVVIITDLEDIQDKEKNKKANMFLREFFEFWQKITKDNICMVFLVSDLLMKTVNDDESEEVLFKHDCNDFQQSFSFKKGLTRCKCSFLDLIFRFNLKINEFMQEFLESFLFNLFSNFQFKKFLVKSYSRMSLFLMGIEKVPCSIEIGALEEEKDDIKETNYKFSLTPSSKLRSLFTQFFSEELMEAFLEEGFLEKSLSVIKELLDSISEETFNKIYEKFLDFYNVFFFVNERKGNMQKKLVNSDFLLLYISSLFLKVKEKSLIKGRNVDIEKEKLHIHIQKCSLKLIEEYLLHLYTVLDKKAFIEVIEGLLRRLQKEKELFFFPDINSLKTNNSFSLRKEPFLNAINILLSYWFLIKAPNDRIENNIMNEDFVELLYERNSRIILLYQYYIKQKAINNDIIDLRLLLTSYFSSNNTALLDYHISGLQVLGFFLTKAQKKRLLTIQNPLYHQNNSINDEEEEILSKEMALFKEEAALLDEELDLCKEEEEILKEELVLMEKIDLLERNEHEIEKLFKDFPLILSQIDRKAYLSFIILIITNQTAFLNSTSLFKLTSNDFRSSIIDHLIINILLAYPKLSYKELNQGIKMNFNGKNLNINDNILKLTELNPNTKEFRLKNEENLLLEYEPFFWGNKPDIGAVYFERLRDLSKKNPNFDSLLGAEGVYKGNPLIIKGIDNLKEACIIKELVEMLIHPKEKKKEVILKGNIGGLNEERRFLLKIIYLLVEKKGDKQEINEKLISFLDKAISNQDFDEINASLIRIKTAITQKSLNIPENKQDLLKNHHKEQKKLLLEKFSLKQKAFLSKNLEFTLENEQNPLKPLISSFFCSICQEKTDSESILFEIAGFLTLDSLHNYYYRDSIEKNTFLNNDRYLIISCNHQAHETCFSAYISKKPIKLSKSLYDYNCFCCKFPSNIKIPVISTFYHKNQDIITNNDKKPVFVSDNLDSLIANIEKTNGFQKGCFLNENSEITVKKAVEEFSNSLMGLIVGSLNIDFIGEFHLIEVLMDSLLFFSEEAFCEGLDYFLKARFLITRNTFLILKQIFSCYFNDNSKSFGLYLADFKRDLIKDLIKLEDFMFLRNIDVFFAKILWKIALLFLFDDIKLKESLFLLCKVFINKLLLIFSYNLLYEFEKAPKSMVFERLLKAFEDYDFRIKVLSYLLPYFQFIAGLLFVVFGKDPRSKESQNDYTFLSMEINEQLLFLSGHFGDLFNMDLNFFTPSLKYLSIIEETPLLVEIRKNPCLKFELPSLKQDFLSFYSHYIERRCSNCHDFPRKEGNFLYLCLICEEINCIKYCGKEPSQDLIGNLTKHSIEKHAGKTFFVRLMDGEVIWMDVPKILIWDFLYSDSLGQHMNIKSLNWVDFLVNEGKMERIRRIAVRREIGQEIGYRMIENSSKIVITTRI